MSEVFSFGERIDGYEVSVLNEREVRAGVASFRQGDTTFGIFLLINGRIRLQGLRVRYELKQIRSATERVLQLMRMRCGKDGVFSMTGSLKDVAADVGLTHEAFYRALAALEKQGRIARSAGSIRMIGRRD